MTFWYNQFKSITRLQLSQILLRLKQNRKINHAHNNSHLLLLQLTGCTALVADQVAHPME